MTSTLPNGPYGFKPIRHQRGGVIRANEYNIASAYGTSIFAGDLVSTTGTGRNIAVATLSAKVRGVFKGVNYVDSSGNVRFEKYWAASTVLAAGTVAKALVYDDPQIVFSCMTDAALANTSVNAFVSFVGQSSGSTLTGMSAEVAHPAAHTGTANVNVPLFVLNLTSVPGNDYGGFSELEVLLAQHELGSVPTATGS